MKVGVEKIKRADITIESHCCSHNTIIQGYVKARHSGLEK